MDRAKLRKFARYLESNHQRFDMSIPCNCLAGHARRFLRRRDEVHDEVVLTEGFGLNAEQAMDLWLGHEVQWEKVTRSIAARTLRHLARTGRVNFKQFLPASGRLTVSMSR